MLAVYEYGGEIVGDTVNKIAGEYLTADKRTKQFAYGLLSSVLALVSLGILSGLKVVAESAVSTFMLLLITAVTLTLLVLYQWYHAKAAELKDKLVVTAFISMVRKTNPESAVIYEKELL